MQVLGIGQTKHVRSHVYIFGTLGEIHIHSGQIRIISKSHKIHFGVTTQPLFPSLDSHFSQARISTLLFLFSLCCVLSLGRRAYCRTADSARGGKARENNRSIIIPTYLFIGWGHCQIFGYGLWVEQVVIVSHMLSHCTGSYGHTYVECTLGMSICRQGGNSKNLIIQGM